MAFNSVSDLLFVPLFPIDRNNSELKFCRCVGGPIPQLGAMPNLWLLSRQILLPDSGIFQLISSLYWDFLVATNSSLSLVATHLCSIS